HDLSHRHRPLGFLQSRGDRLPLFGSKYFVRLAYESPAASVLVELGGELRFLYISATEIDLHHPRMPLHHNNRVGRTAEAKGSADFIERVIIRWGFPKMAIDDNPDLVFARELLSS